MEKRLLVHELYEYLVSLSEQLDVVGDAETARRVLHVSRFVSGSTTELYGEARLLLPSVLHNTAGTLSESERARMRDIIAGIESEFVRIGGA